MAFTPLTEEQYNNAISSGFSSEKIIKFEQKRKEESLSEEKPKSLIQEQNILGNLLNVPAATSRAAIRSNPALAATGPLAGLLARSGVAGEETKQAAGAGALRPDSIETFQSQAIRAGQNSFGGPSTSVGLNFIKGLVPSAVGLAADMAVDPTQALTSMIGGLVTSKVKPISSMVEKSFIQSVKPTLKGVKTSGKLKSLKNAATSSVESIVDNKNNLKIVDSVGNVIEGKLPETLDEFSQAISQTKKLIFNQYDEILKNAGQSGVRVPLKPISEDILKSISSPVLGDLSPSVQNYGLKLATTLEKRGTYTLQESQDAIEALNANLKSYFNSPTPQSIHKAVIDSALAKNLRESLSKIVESNSGAGYKLLRNQYGSLNQIEDNVTRAALNFSKSADNLGNLADIFSSGSIVGGIKALHPGEVTKGVFQLAARNIHKAMNSPNKAISDMFKNVDRAKNIDPAIRTLKNLVKNLPPTLVRTSPVLTESGVDTGNAEASMTPQDKANISKAENFGKETGDYAQIEDVVLEDLKKFKGLDKNITLKQVKSDPKLYDKVVNMYWDRLDDFGIPDKDKALWWLMPGRYKKSGGNIENITGPTPEKTKEFKNIMRNRVKNMNK